MSTTGVHILKFTVLFSNKVYYVESMSIVQLAVGLTIFWVVDMCTKSWYNCLSTGRSKHPRLIKHSCLTRTHKAHGSEE